MDSAQLVERSPLLDAFDRQFHYLRLSITDLCNLRCTYCLPNGYCPGKYPADPLGVSEIKNLVTAFSALGIWKVRLTGGEPTIRKDLPTIVQTLKTIPGIKKVALTTNGIHFVNQAEVLRAAGLNAVNISIDSLNPDNFQKITGSKHFKRVFESLEKALDLGFEQVKVNVVLLKNINDQELDLFYGLIRNKRISLRFIELMQTGDNKLFYKNHYKSGSEFIWDLKAYGWKPIERALGAGPAQEFIHPDFIGKIGVIAPYSKDFCQTCNRLRVTSRGDLRLCLFGEKDFSLRPLLRSPDQKEELLASIRRQISLKEPTHFLKFEKFGNTNNLSSIGG